VSFVILFWLTGVSLRLRRFISLMPTWFLCVSFDRDIDNEKGVKRESEFMSGSEQGRVFQQG